MKLIINTTDLNAGVLAATRALSACRYSKAYIYAPGETT